MNRNNSILLNLFVVMVLDLLAFTCILPLFPALMDYYALKSEKGDFYDVLTGRLKSFQNLIGVPQNYRYNSVLFGGFLGSMFSFLQFVSSPVLGTLSDTIGRKPLLLLSILGSVLSYVLWSRAYSFEMFILSRFVGGLSKASVSVATAIVADVMPTKSRGKGMVLIGAAFSIGFIIGPMIGAYFAHKSRSSTIKDAFPHLPPYFAIGLSTVQLFWVLFFMPETLQTKSTKGLKETLRKTLDFVSPASLFTLNRAKPELTTRNLQRVRKLGLINFTFLLIYSGLEFTLTFFTHLFFDYSSMQQGQVYFVMGIIMVLIQGCYVRRIPTEKQELVAKQGLIAICLSFLLIGLTELIRYKFVLYCSLVLFAFGSATVVTSLTTMVSSCSSETEQGTALGLFRSLGALARAIGPCLASAVFWMFGAATCYCLGGLAMILPYYLLRSLRSEDGDLSKALLIKGGSR